LIDAGELPRFRIAFGCAWDFLVFADGRRLGSNLIYAFENYLLDAERRELRRGSVLVAVEPGVFDLLQYLICNRERVVSRDDLIAAVWNGRIVSESTLAGRINAARSALGDDGEQQRLLRTFPRKGFRFVGEVLEEHQLLSDGSTAGPAPPTNEVVAQSAAVPLPERPSIAVLPFINMSGDREQEYFSDGITEDIITELSRFSELFVIARNSSFTYKGRAVDVRQVGRELGVRYVLEGSIRHAGDRVRVAGQLIDATTGAHRWAEHYDRKLEDVFAIQDEVARTIVGIITAHVNKAEVERALLKAPAIWQAYDYYMRAADTFASFWSSASSVKAESLYETRRLLEHCLSTDPTYARAYGLLSHTHLASGLNPVDDDFLNPFPLDRAHQLAVKAVQLEPNSPQALAHLGSALIWKCEHDGAILMFERAIALNPNFSQWRYAVPLILSGEFSRAIEVVEAHMQRDPFVPPYALTWLGFAHYMLRRYADALPPLRECVSRANYWFGHVLLAATYAQLGQLEQAEAATAEVRRMAPTFRLAPGDRFKQLKDAQHYFDGLRKANLPAD
jgi:adenylate cyclase